MFFHILKRDIKRKRTINIILLIFVILATTFLAASTNNLMVINNAVDYFLDISNTPDFICIYTEETVQQEIADYLTDSVVVQEFETIDTIVLIDANITVDQSETHSLDEPYEKTNMLCVSAVPTNFMKVFDYDGNELELQDDEIAFSKVEADANNLEVGDKVTIKIGEVEQQFTIATLTKDAVFGSTTIGFKRLLISQEAFERYGNQPSTTYTRITCINYEDKNAFDTEWNKKAFPVASAIEKGTIRMCYVFDMLMAAILVIVSICLILISFLVLRFTIVFTLQEDYKEIGIMKAIGVKDMGIKGVYLVKYLALAVVGAVLGFFLSFPFGEVLMKQTIVNIPLESGENHFFLNVISALAIIGIILWFCYHSTNRLKKFSAMDAIRSGSNGERYKVKNHLKLKKRGHMRPSLYMAFNDVLCNKRRFLALFITFAIGTMMILLPLNAMHTLQGDHIVDMFSLSPSDVYVTGMKEPIEPGAAGIKQVKGRMDEIECILKEHGLEGKVWAEQGYMMPSYSDDPEQTFQFFTLQTVGDGYGSYAILDGREPILGNEIMITEITAKKMNVGIGDSIYFQSSDKVEEFVITGTYQSMINMGNGYRVSKEAELESTYGTGILAMQIELTQMDTEEAYDILTEILPDYKIQTLAEFIDTMTGNIIGQIGSMFFFILIIVLLINGLITVLMMRTIMAGERGDIALLKSLGFSNGAVRCWQTARILVLLTVGIAVGTIVSNLSAPFILGPIFAMMGANQVVLELRPLEAYVIYPLILLLVTGIAAFVCAGEVNKVDMKEVNNIE